MINGKNILFAVSSLGLGHATRELPTIKYFARNNQIFIISFGQAFMLLRSELEGPGFTFFEYEDYPLSKRGKGLMFLVDGIMGIIRTNRIMRKEHELTEEIVDKHNIDFIITDCRYGCYSDKIPSFALSHQISFALPKAFKFIKIVTNAFNYYHFKRFTKVFIPDFKEEHKNLSGKLSHNRLAAKLQTEYIGIFSSLSKLKIEKDIDYLFIISGFMKEYIDSFFHRLMKEARKLSGIKVFVKGDMTKDDHYFEENNIEIYSHATGNLRNELLNRAKVIISRSGYTTVMDLVEIDGVGILIPTSALLIDQEYLAEHYIEENSFVAFKSEKSFTLKGIDKKIRSTEFFRSKKKTKDSLEKIEAVISKYLIN
jgi:uncharacterized protein (TIGR00661 family)